MDGQWERVGDMYMGSAMDGGRLSSLGTMKGADIFPIITPSQTTWLVLVANVISKVIS